MKARKYTKELLADAVSNSFSFAGVLRYLGLRQAGGTQSHITRSIRYFEIDTSHFTQQAHNKGKLSARRLTPDMILILMPEGSPRQRSTLLVRALLESGVEHRCSICYTGITWNDKPMTLDVDHIDGNWVDNRIANLRFLCPNCHSQQPTGRPHKYKESAHATEEHSVCF